MKSKFRLYIFICWVCSITQFPIKAMMDDDSPSNASASMSQTGTSCRQVEVERKIGVEIETSALKVALNHEENDYSGFLIKNEAGRDHPKVWWMPELRDIMLDVKVKT